ncbi:MAG: zinc-ribbon domain-containing protein [Flavobacterium sp.]|uniref:zinc-ribbon domain-containing protein n=1 Tax=Flavobacterium sp. TaxID=239 RepID=UPI0032663215
MFFYGVKSKSLKKGMLTSIHCDYCDEDSEMEYNFLQKYFHLYWIPLFPLKKKTEVSCENCGHLFQNKEITKDITQKLNRVKDRYPTRTPVWAFSGIIILVLFFTWAFWQSGRHEVVEGDYIKNPKKGDIYFLNFTPGNYTTLRIDKVDKTNVYYTLNDTSVYKYTKVFFIEDDKYYTNKKGIYTRQKIEDFYKKDSIISIKRK